MPGTSSTSSMPSPRTLVDLLTLRARTSPDRPAFLFGDRPTSFAELEANVRRFAARLRAQGVERGEPVLLTLPNGEDFFTAFYGVERAGAVPVPLFPRSGKARLRRFARLVSARRRVVPPDEETTVPELETIPVPRHDDTPAPPADTFPEPARGDVAWIQITSGSTGAPKGVVLTHENVLANLEHLIAGFEITADDVFISWLPVHHDMGLVLMTMVPFRLAAKLVLLPTTLRRADRWLAAITEHGGTFTAAPDFAWRHVVRTVRDPERFDLQSLRVALDAAEPVRPATIEGFETKFGLSNVMIAGYGLAEATVGVAAWPPGMAPKVDARGLVSVGKPFPGVDIAVLGDDGRPLAPGETGEVVLRSAATTRGYTDDPEATAALQVAADVAAGDGFVRTGDLGYVDADGDLFLVGRLKNVILHAGRNLAPQEIEEIAESVPAVGRAAAVGIERHKDREGEQVVVFAERRVGARDEEPSEIAREIVARLHDELGVRPARVVLLKPRSIPQTETGKLRHPELRERYLDGRLREEGRVLFPDF